MRRYFLMLCILFQLGSAHGSGYELFFNWNNVEDCNKDGYTGSRIMHFTITTDNIYLWPLGDNGWRWITVQSKKRGLFTSWKNVNEYYHRFFKQTLTETEWYSKVVDYVINNLEKDGYDFRIIIEYEKDNGTRISEKIFGPDDEPLMNNQYFEPKTDDGICPVAPTNLYVTRTTNNSVRLNWSSVYGSCGYKVHYRKIGGIWSEKLTAITYCDISELDCNANYEFRVATNYGEEVFSGWSDILAFKTESCPKPDAPSNGKPQGNIYTIKDNSDVTFTWDGSATKYKLYLRVQGDNYWDLVATTYNKEYTYPNLVSNKLEWKVVAIGDDTQETEGPIWKFEIIKRQLEIDKASVPLASSSGSSGTLTISSNTSWSISGVPNWLTVSQQSGNGNATITVSAKYENNTTSNNSCTLIITGGGISKTVTVTQSGKNNTLDVDKASVTLPSLSGSSGSFAITSNTSWSISGVPNWLTVSQQSGNGNATITVSAKYENTATTKNTCTLNITGGGISKTIDVIQEYKTTYTLSLDKSSLTFSSTKSEFKDFTIYSNTSWKITDKPIWINLSASSSSGDRLIHISTASENTSTSSRSGTVTVKTTDGAVTKTILVTQEGYNSSKTLTVSPSSSLSFDSSMHLTGFKVISNTSWSISKNQTWIECSPTSGSGETSITVTIYTNASTSSRSGNITVKTTDGSITKTISVTQEGYTPPKTLTVSPSSFYLDPSNRSTAFNVVSNTNWTVSKDQTWIECSPTSGSGNNSITFTIGANTSISSRSGTITVKTTDGSITKTISITQNGTTIEANPKCNTQDSLALVALYNSCNGDNWTDKTGWLISPVKDWYGITVENTRVTKIYLQVNKLIGTLPAEMSTLSELQELNLAINELSGNISDFLYQLTKLKMFYVPINGGLTGVLTDEISNLTNLEVFSVGGNKLSGSIPRSIGNLKSLKKLDLAANDIAGTIPIEITKLLNLWDLKLEFNSLTGNIPDEIGNLTNLYSLQLQGNALSGDVPNSLTNLKLLHILNLSHNKFESLPKFDLSKITGLEQFQVHFNNLEFDDLEQNTALSTLNNGETTSLGYVYAPQNKIGDEESISVTKGERYALKIKCGGANNLYEWYKDGLLISEKSKSDSLVIFSMSESDVGQYYCVITNTVVPDLVLESKVKNLSIKNVAATLNSITISGPTSIEENSTANYTCTAYYDDGTSKDVTNLTTWSENSAFTTINSAGRLSSTSVNSLQISTITASYEGYLNTQNVSIEKSTEKPISITIDGREYVNENSISNYKCYANYSDGSTKDITNSTLWSINSNLASINSNGVIKTDSVQNYSNCTITATYGDFSSTHNLVIVNVGKRLECSKRIRISAVQGYDFSEQTIGLPDHGDFYFNIDRSKPMLLANNTGQRGIVTLGLITNELLTNVIVPTSGFTNFGVEAIKNHIYVSKAQEGEEGNYIVFKVLDASFNYVEIEYIYINANRVMLVGGDSYDFSTLKTGFINGGDFYFNGNRFGATYPGQRGISNLGNIGNLPLNQTVFNPSANFSRFGFDAILCNTYISLAQEGEENNFIVFKVQRIANSEVLLDYLYTKSNINFVESSKLYNSVKFFPNPAKKEINFQFSNFPINYNIEFYNNLGQLVIKKKSSNQTEKLDLTGIISGIYYLKIYNDEFSKTEKIIVQ